MTEHPSGVDRELARLRAKAGEQDVEIARLSDEAAAASGELAQLGAEAGELHRREQALSAHPRGLIGTRAACAHR